MKATKVNKMQPLLHKLFNNAINNSTSFVGGKYIRLKKKPQEPDFIASLIIIFAPELFNILKQVFPKNKFSVTGIYCHQKPLADIGQKKSPEIGDILFVYIYTDPKGLKTHNSLLFQAKVSSKEVTPIRAMDKHQLQLYTTWPKFTYQRAGCGLNGVSRDILPKTINDGGQYLLIDTHPIYGLSGIPGTYPMGCAMPNDPLYLDKNLSEELIDFIKFKSGRVFEENSNITNDDWTKMIWDIMKITKNVSSRRKYIVSPDFQRQFDAQHNGCCYYMSETNSIFSDLHRELDSGINFTENDNNFDEENGGLSLILIENNEQIMEKKRRRV